MTAEEQLAYLRSPQAARDAQQYVSRALRLDNRISLKLAQLDALREKRARLYRALGKAPEDHPPEPDLKAREEEVLADYSALLRLQKDISSRVHQVPHPMQQAVLDMRYLQGAPFFRIAMALHYDERQIYRLHRAGLRHVAGQLMQEGLLPKADAIAFAKNEK